MRPHYGKRGTERGLHFLQALRKGKESPATTDPRHNHISQRTNGDVVSLNRPGLRGDPPDAPPFFSSVAEQGLTGRGCKAGAGGGSRLPPPPPPPPPPGPAPPRLRVADSSFLFGLTASTWCARATILFLPPYPQAPGSPLSPPHPQAAFPSISSSPSPLLPVAS